MRWSDIDLAAMATSNDVAEVQSIVLDIAARPLDDGLLSDTSASTATSIRDEDEYAGVRVGLAARLATARLSVHVDVNVGDPIWPRPEAVALPQLLGGAIHLLGYPITMVLAEKLVTAGQRGAANTRWRDFADIYSLIGSQRLDARDVHSAIRVVAEHRGIDVRPLRRQLDGYAEAGQVRWVAMAQPPAPGRPTPGAVRRCSRQRVDVCRRLLHPR